jgi:hypothetical protein
VNLGRKGLLENRVRAVQVSRTHATLVRDGAGLRIVAQGQGPVAVVPAQGTGIRLEKKGAAADVGINDRIVLYPDAPEGRKDESFELIVAMEVEAPAAAPEISQPPAAVDQAQAAALTSDAPMAAPRPAATGRDLMSDLNGASAPAAPVDESSAATARVEPPALQTATDDLTRRMSSEAVSVSLSHGQPKRKELEDSVARNRHKAQAGDKSGEMPTRRMKDTPSKKKGVPDDI